LTTQISRFQYYDRDDGADDRGYDHAHNNCDRGRGDDDELFHGYDCDGYDLLHDCDGDDHVQHRDYDVHHNILVFHDL